MTATSLDLVWPCAHDHDEEESAPVSTTFFRSNKSAAIVQSDEDLWPADPEATAIWEQRSERRRMVRSFGHGCIAALLACASLIGIHASSRDAVVAWGTLGSVRAQPAAPAAAPAYAALPAPAAAEDADRAPAMVIAVPPIVIEASPAPRAAAAPALVARPAPWLAAAKKAWQAKKDADDPYTTVNTAPAKSIWADPYADLAPAKAKPAAQKAKQASSLDDPY
jgi:hypothetical protein